ncbi:MAG: HAD family hydrolase [Gammaproteobacteria bacterium]
MLPDFKLSCVLFDLDGTLLDTAPDLIACLNQALAIHGFEAAEPERIKPVISFGAKAMIAASQKTASDEETQSAVLQTLHELYQNNIAVHSVFFAGMAETLDLIEEKGLKWGVVTNKLERFTSPLMAAFKLTSRAACIISGDSAEKSKPYPEPMLAACRRAGVKSNECVYIGDAAHDIVAGRSAGMKTMAAIYGYLKPADEPAAWGADALIESPWQIYDWIRSQRCR